MKVPRKIKFFLWRAIHDIIPTNFNLKSRGIDLLSAYPICNVAFESMDHVLIKCPRAQLIWSKIYQLPSMDDAYNNNFGERWSTINSSCPKEELNIFAITCWSIWNDRNTINQGKPVPIYTSVEWILKYYNSFIHASKDEYSGRSTLSQISHSTT